MSEDLRVTKTRQNIQMTFYQTVGTVSFSGYYYQAADPGMSD